MVWGNRILGKPPTDITNGYKLIELMESCAYTIKYLAFTGFTSYGDYGDRTGLRERTYIIYVYNN